MQSTRQMTNVAIDGDGDDAVRFGFGTGDDDSGADLPLQPLLRCGDDCGGNN